MILPTQAPLSGLKAFAKKLTATADNVANVQSDAYKRRQVVMQEARQSGVTTEVVEDPRPGPVYETVRDGQTVEVEGSNVDLAEELPDLVIGRIGFAANLKALTAQEEAIGRLIDIMG